MSQNVFVSVCVFCCFFLIWEGSSHIFTNLLFVLPPPSKIFYLIFDKSERFIFHTGITLKEMFGGVFIAFAVAFPLAWLMTLWSTLRMILQPVFVIIQCVPMFALAPIMVIWFDWSFTAIVIPTALMIFFPLTINIYQGLRATPRHLIDYFRINQATPWQIFFKLQLPWSLPHIFSGLRISAAIAGIGAVAGEWAGAQEGLGVLMIESRRGADLETTFGALFCLTFVSLLLYGTATYFEKKVVERKPKKIALKKPILATCAILAGLSIGGCKEPTKNETRMILDWLPNPNHVPLYTGIQKGFFKEQGIDLKILKIHDPGDSVPFIEAEQVELALTYMPHAIRAMTRGANIIPMGILIDQPLNSIIYRSDSTIRDPKDLNGKVIGYCIDGCSTAFLDSLFDENKINPLKKRNVSFDLVSTLGTKRVDAIYGAYWNIEGENLRSYGIETEHFELINLGVPNYYELIFIAKKNSPQSKSDFIQRFKKGLQDSINYSTEHPEEAFDYYLAANPDKGEKVRQWEIEAWLKTIPVLAKSQNIESTVWNDFSQWQIDKGLVTQKIEWVNIQPDD